MAAMTLRISIPIALFCVACGGGGSGATATVDAAGSWAGTWRSLDGSRSGSITLTIGPHGMGHHMSGTCQLDGSECTNGGAFAGMCSGSMVQGSVTDGDGRRLDCSLSAEGSHPERMEGTYAMVVAGACTGESGTLVLDRIGEEAATSSVLAIALSGEPRSSWRVALWIDGPDSEDAPVRVSARGDFGADGMAEIAIRIPPGARGWLSAARDPVPLPRFGIDFEAARGP